jgi:branched-chain amino acid transport system ATP-binding protein
MSDPLLQIENAAIRFGGVAAVDGVSMEIHPGELVALIGANGAGKSSLIGALAGVVALSAGMMRFQGGSLAGLPSWRRARLGIGFSLEGRRVFPGLTVRENLVAGASGDAGDLTGRLTEIFALFPVLEARKDAAAWQLSGGQQQMLAAGRALMRAPRLAVFDEPTLGLAPATAHDLLTAIRRVAGGSRGVLIADQNAARILPLADRAYVMSRGRITAAGAGAELMNSPALADALLGG